MKEFDELLKRFDLEYFGTGQHKAAFDTMMAAVRDGSGIALDVRTKQELECVRFPFAAAIPTDEIPDRLSDIPEGKTVYLFCSSATRAAIVFAYLTLRGYAAKIVAEPLSTIAGNFKPGYVRKNQSV